MTTLNVAAPASISSYSEADGKVSSLDYEEQSLDDLTASAFRSGPSISRPVFRTIPQYTTTFTGFTFFSRRYCLGAPYSADYDGQPHVSPHRLIDRFFWQNSMSRPIGFGRFCLAERSLVVTTSDILLHISGDGSLDVATAPAIDEGPEFS